MAAESKRCCTCQELRPLTDFNVRRRASDGLQSRCRSCCRAWYLANQEGHKARVAARNRAVRQENAARLVAYLELHPCVDCGEDDIRVLEFDHLDPGDKRIDVGKLAAYATSWGRIEAEIARCLVRCANCHRRRTAEMAGWARHRTESSRRAHRASAAAARLDALRLTA